MSDLPTYSFLPWLRHGIANTIQSPDEANSVFLRANIQVSLAVSANKIDNTPLNQSINKDIDLYAPGDIVGLDSRSIVKVDPRNWITNFEPNYLPYIDFYEEDLPWRYTPAKTNDQRLRPWIALVVLKTEEFEEKSKGDDQPLPSIKLKAGVNAADVFPDPTQLWAWAHVHVNKDLASGTDVSNPAVVTNLSNTLKQNPDLAYSRIICPRKLQAKGAYHAFLIPVFESGRLAGLGMDILTTTVATAGSWSNNQTEFPYYYRWYFRTGALGDFEYLVNLLKPQPTDKQVGVRDIDVLHPGSNLPPLTEPPELNGILKLGGALKVPFNILKEEDKTEVRQYDTWDEDPYPHVFEKRMADLINLADDYTVKTPLEANKDAQLASAYEDDDPDPVITMPLYGRWHALVNRLLKNKDGSPVANNNNWVHELNLDPRFRVAAGIGTKVIQGNQEEYMDSAWQQVGDVIEANRKIKLAELAKEVSFFFYKKHFSKLNTSQLLAITAPIQKRVLTNGMTLHYTMEHSKVPTVVTSTVFRKFTRPGGAVAKRIMKNTSAETTLKKTDWVGQINSGRLIIAPPKSSPQQGLLLTKASEAIKPTGLSGSLGPFAVKNKWMKWILLILAFIILIIALLTGILGLFIVGGLFAAGFYFLNKAEKDTQPSLSLLEENQTPQSVDRMPQRPDFRISQPDAGFNPQTGNTDSRESGNFKRALKDAYQVTQIKYAAPERATLNLAEIPVQVLQQIHPDTVIPKRVKDIIQIPERIKTAQADEGFVPVMAYPELDIPMYQPLSKLSTELFLPNIHLIPENSISLLETNQKFIESYMAGINHEMSRELLWREYPTDQRGSYFRQFWDVSSFYPGNPAPTDIKEKLRDIPPIHKWLLNTQLGQHNQRETGGDAAQLVLVIRGELLKRYPTAVIYAQKAEWDTTSGTNDPTKERKLVALTAAEEVNPRLSKIKTPLFEAKVEPDIYFFGFDLTDIEVKGGTLGTENPGWFFVIKERPGEPRFGLDEPAEDIVPRLINWNNLSWKHLNTAEGSCIRINQTLSFTPYNAGTDQENMPNAADAQASWSPATNAAQLAYILYQVPVMVAVHGSRMLP